MKHIHAGSSTGEFRNLAATSAAQAILMTLQPGETSDDEPSNEHPRCEQWMFVLDGEGTVIRGKGSAIAIEAGSLVVIEKRELHQIRATGKKPLRTLNFYIPPAYGKGGRLLSGAKPAKKQQPR